MDSVRRNYNRLARWYDRLSGEKEHQLSRDLVDRMDFPTRGFILDLGCGTGQNLLSIAGRLGKTGYAVGLDYSERMCMVARDRMLQQEISTRFLVLQADARAIPFAEGTLDGILMSFSLELFNEREVDKVIAEVLRVLKIGAKLGVICMSAEPNPGIPDQLYRLSHRMFPVLIDCRPIQLDSILNRVKQKLESFQRKRLWGLSVAEAILVKIKK